LYQDDYIKAYFVISSAVSLVRLSEVR